MFKPGILTMTLAALAIGTFAPISAHASVSRGDRSFVKQAGQAGMGEVMAAQIALQRGVDGNVRSFAQQMLRDHSKAGQELKKIASSEGIAMPKSLDPTSRAQIDKLRSLSGADFDTAYSQFQVRDHKAAIALFQKEARNGRVTSLRQFAQSTLPTLKMHRSMIYQVVASMQPMSSRMAHRRMHMK